MLSRCVERENRSEGLYWLNRLLKRHLDLPLHEQEPISSGARAKKGRSFAIFVLCMRELINGYKFDRRIVWRWWTRDTSRTKGWKWSHFFISVNSGCLFEAHRKGTAHHSSAVIFSKGTLQLLYFRGTQWNVNFWGVSHMEFGNSSELLDESRHFWVDETPCALYEAYERLQFYSLVAA
jgi:hypothetical protein